MVSLQLHAKRFYGVPHLGLGIRNRKVGYPQKGYGMSLQVRPHILLTAGRASQENDSRLGHRSRSQQVRIKLSSNFKTCNLNPLKPRSPQSSTPALNHKTRIARCPLRPARPQTRTPSMEGRSSSRPALKLVGSILFGPASEKKREEIRRALRP